MHGCIQNGMTALDWAEEGEHVEVAELLSHAMSEAAAAAHLLVSAAEAESETKPTDQPTEVQGQAAPAADGMPQTEAEAVSESAPTAAAPAHEESAFAEANPIDEEHMTALVHAAHHGNLEEVKQLLAQGSDVNAKDEVRALHRLSCWLREFSLTGRCALSCFAARHGSAALRGQRGPLGGGEGASRGGCGGQLCGRAPVHAVPLGVRQPPSGGGEAPGAVWRRCQRCRPGKKWLYE